MESQETLLLGLLLLISFFDEKKFFAFSLSFLVLGEFDGDAVVVIVVVEVGAVDVDGLDESVVEVEGIDSRLAQEEGEGWLGSIMF